MIPTELNINRLVGMEAKECFRLLDEQNVKYVAETLTDKKAVDFDRELVIAVRERENYLQLIVGRFKFSV